MDQQKIGRFLKALRKEKGLTQEQLAEQFSYPRKQFRAGKPEVIACYEP